MIPSSNNTSATTLVRLLAGHFVVAAGEWAVAIAVLVYTFQTRGTAATGLASICLLLATIAGSPVAGWAVATFRSYPLRLAALGLQVAGCMVGGFAMAADMPFSVVLPPAMLVMAAFTVIRPAQAILIPLLSQSPRQLVQTSVWAGHGDNVGSADGTRDGYGAASAGRTGGGC